MTWKNFRTSALKCEGPKWENLDNARCERGWEQVHHNDTLGPSVIPRKPLLEISIYFRNVKRRHKSWDRWLVLVSYFFLLGSWQSLDLLRSKWPGFHGPYASRQAFSWLHLHVSPQRSAATTAYLAPHNKANIPFCHCSEEKCVPGVTCEEEVVSLEPRDIWYFPKSIFLHCFPTRMSL